MRGYLEDYVFTVGSSITLLVATLEEPAGRIDRWMFELQQDDFVRTPPQGELEQIGRRPLPLTRSVQHSDCTKMRVVSKNSKNPEYGSGPSNSSIIKNS